MEKKFKNKNNWFWIIKSKEHFPAIIHKNKNFWGDEKPYNGLRDIKLDLGDRFEYAVKYWPPYEIEEL